MPRMAYTIDFGPLTLYMSYEHVVGFAVAPVDDRLRANGPAEVTFAENLWGNITSKHIGDFRLLTHNNAPPLPDEQFRQALNRALREHGLARPKVRFF